MQIRSHESEFGCQTEQPATLARARDSEESMHLVGGDVVEVRSWAEILPTLDNDGKLDALPFMPEMLRFCNKQFVVNRRIERTCEETKGSMRRICNTIFLDELRCDGTGHGGCGKGCRIFWKEAWLTRPGHKENPPTPDELSEYPFPCRSDDGQYVCQSTELVHATSPLRAVDPRWILRDIRARTYTPLRLIRILSYALFLRLRARFTRTSPRCLQGSQTKTASLSLDLQPGDIVRVRSKEQIAATLDKHGNNRGLAFTLDMVRFCGGTFRVLRRLDKMIKERNRSIISLKATVILENVTCHGCYKLSGGCPRDNYHFWREIWLEKIS